MSFISSYFPQYFGNKAPGAGEGGSAKSQFFVPDFNASYGDFRTRSIAGTGGHRFLIQAPPEASVIQAIDLFGIPIGASAAAQIDLTSDYGAEGEAYNAHSEAAIGGVFNFGTADQITKVSLLSLIFNNIQPGDFAGFFVDHNGIGTTIHYIGTRVTYL